VTEAVPFRKRLLRIDPHHLNGTPGFRGGIQLDGGIRPREDFDAQPHLLANPRLRERQRRGVPVIGLGGRGSDQPERQSHDDAEQPRHAPTATIRRLKNLSNAGT
jgi:hypothetical protein